jgi:hypothetical protein
LRVELPAALYSKYRMEILVIPLQSTAVVQSPASQVCPPRAVSVAGLVSAMLAELSQRIICHDMWWSLLVRVSKLSVS